MLPDPIPMNAADEDDEVRGVIEAAAAALAAHVAVLPLGNIPPSCRRLELLLLGSSVPSPVLTHAHGGRGLLLSEQSYGDALAASGLVLLAASAAGLVISLSLWAVRRRGFADAATVARFLATALQIFVFLSPGAAIASGLAIGAAVGNGEAVGVAPIAGAAVIAAAPVCWAIVVAVAVRRATEGKGLVLSVAAAGAFGDKSLVAGADDDPLNDADPYGANHTAAPGGCLGGRVLLCGGVRPLAVAQRLGPLVGDLGGCYPHRNTLATIANRDAGPSGAALRSLVPAALPWALLITSGAVGASNACEHMPIAAAALIALYAALIAAFRPFTGYSHNAFEVLWSIVAAGLLVWLWVAFADADDGGGGGNVEWSDAFSPSEHAAVTCLGALLSCRYPFVLARALGVGFPCVASMKQRSESTIKIRASYCSAQQSASDETNDNCAFHVPIKVKEEEEVATATAMGTVAIAPKTTTTTLTCVDFTSIDGTITPPRGGSSIADGDVVAAFPNDSSYSSSSQSPASPSVRSSVSIGSLPSAPPSDAGSSASELSDTSSDRETSASAPYAASRECDEVMYI